MYGAREEEMRSKYTWFDILFIEIYHTNSILGVDYKGISM